MNAEVMLYMLNRMPSRREVEQTCWCGRSLCLGNRAHIEKKGNFPKHGYVPGPWWWPFRPRG